MAHALTINAFGNAEMAYTGATPWHGLGQQLPENASISDWRTAAGMDWQINSSPAMYKNGIIHQMPEYQILYRSDTNAGLSVVSSKYKVVQPEAVLEFFRDMVADEGFKIETAGTLFGGRRFWALANTGHNGDVVTGDNVKGYLLLATSCDGGLATTAQFTSVRVVCNNTLQMSLHKNINAAARVRIRHNQVFDPENVKGLLGIQAKSVFGQFLGRMQQFSERSVSMSEAERAIEMLMMGTRMPSEVRDTKGFKKVISLFAGEGKGADLPGVAGTAWGLINAVTEYGDFHKRANNANNRLNSAWFGESATMKARVVEILDTIN